MQLLLLTEMQVFFSSVDLPNKKVFYGFKLPDDKPENDFKAPVNTDGVLCPKCDHILHYHERIYANLGDYFCPNCGYHRPDLTYTVNEIIDQTPNSLKFKMGEKRLQYRYRWNLQYL